MVLRASKLIKTKYKYVFSKLNSDYTCMKRKKKSATKISLKENGYWRLT